MAALKKYHGDGGETELVRLEFEEIRAAIEHEKRACCNSQLLSTAARVYILGGGRDANDRWCLESEGYHLAIDGQHKGEPIPHVPRLLHGLLQPMVRKRPHLLL